MYHNNKKADSNAILPLLQKRWSPRAFSEREIDTDVLTTIMEAAQWSASSYNEQPWRYIIGSRNTETFNTIVEGLVEFNQLWAPQAAVLIVTLARKKFDNEEAHENLHAWHDVGAASAQLTIQALSHDVYVHQMAGFDAGALRASFDVSDEYDIVTVLALGYEGDPATLPEGLQDPEKGDRNRKPLSEIILKQE